MTLPSAFNELKDVYSLVNCKFIVGDVFVTSFQEICNA